MMEMRDRAEELAARWRSTRELMPARHRARQHDLCHGFEGRLDYGAIGTVTNLAARLCGEAQGGQILISQRVHAAVSEIADTEPLGELNLKGFLRPMAVFRVSGLKPNRT
jgi:class 3 adenylate cyclase